VCNLEEAHRIWNAKKVSLNLSFVKNNTEADFLSAFGSCIKKSALASN
jgi:hypothetical protein